MKPVKLKEIEEGKIVAILSYLLVGILWFFIDEEMKKNSFVKFHVKQGLALVIIGFSFSILISILFGMVGFMMVNLSFMVLGGLSQIINLGLLVLSVMGIISAINGTKKELPWIELITKKLTF